MAQNPKAQVFFYSFIYLFFYRRQLPNDTTTISVSFLRIDHGQSCQASQQTIYLSCVSQLSPVVSQCCFPTYLIFFFVVVVVIILGNHMSTQLSLLSYWWIDEREEKKDEPFPRQFDIKADILFTLEGHWTLKQYSQNVFAHCLRKWFFFFFIVAAAGH